ncbi:MAG: 4-hydroxy-tetrahydrodipicolinate reductase [Synergistaceae bacterium]|nr:4-hydroxy-tetrahydrodipicolinate reductase [Synergistaceae bacterium]MBR0074364.1 4-hydroxy-tetrahydrodipicolinate reductase [Synergistaceae bacterium]MBR0081043.1 4-hydroxy-tetrahydrodipicolinate reductase [Synergistaceae bacterium]MBR0232621.1 4-hydroxy-tetrahydrodipicolinate reductase [Synergistaceae bacterium]MBR0317632.1 4-hydroxy-tetrahydrodipicolinate reductase [Synergistaceae bacterium]
MNLIINGAGGKMGKILTDMAVQNGENVIGADIAEGYSRLEDISADADCVIDFSNHKAAESVINYCVKKNLPVLIASTGHDENELKLIHDASTKIPVFLSSNMSLGVALLADLAERVTKVFGQCDIELIEAHHNQKLDVPSGTALTLAKRIQEADKNLTFNIGRHENGKRSQNEIGIHSLRYGSEVGTHEIIFSNGLETITLRHDAKNRALFAKGALSAVKWLVKQKPGFYDMRDFLKGE